MAGTHPPPPPQVLRDAEDLLTTPVVGGLIKGALARVDPTLDPAESVLPLTRLPGPLGIPTFIPIPNLTRLYFQFYPAVDMLAEKRARGLDRPGVSSRGDAAWLDLYAQIRTTVEQGMQELLVLRQGDGERSVGARLQKNFADWLPLLSTANAAQQQQQQDSRRL